MIETRNSISHEEKKVSISSFTRNKQIKITFNNKIKAISNVSSFEDLVRYMFKETGHEYFSDLPAGIETRLKCENWFNFWFEDADRETYEIANELDFQKCLRTY